MGSRKKSGALFKNLLRVEFQEPMPNSPLHPIYESLQTLGTSNRYSKPILRVTCEMDRADKDGPTGWSTPKGVLEGRVRVPGEVRSALRRAGSFHTRRAAVELLEKEAMTLDRWTGFGVVWLPLAVLALGMLVTARRNSVARRGKRGT